MIGEAELRRSAARAGVDLMVLDLDYALGWFLAGLFSQTEAASRLIFKGETCLRKCYFTGYRFSEDLDFTLSSAWSLPEIGNAIEAVQQWSARAGGPNFAPAPLRLEIVSDDYGAEVFQARLYYRGPLRWGGSPRSIRLDISRGEHLAFPAEQKSLLHGYSDSKQLPKARIRCYSLAEMIAEKLRAISGQRRFVIARDVYDLYHLAQTGVPLEQVRAALPAKFAAKGIELPISVAADLEQNRALFAADWNRRLAHLLPADDPLTFESAWASLLQLVIDLSL